MGKNDNNYAHPGRICAYPGCQHEGRLVDILSDKCVKVNQRYYHQDCFEKQRRQKEKQEKDKLNIQRIKNIWIDKINPHVVQSYLYKELNTLIKDKKIPSEYVLFVVQYCVDNKCGLHFPPGIKYYVDKQYIKDAYARYTRSKVKIDPDAFTVDHDETDAPKFKAPEQKKQGFGSILGG